MAKHRGGTEDGETAEANRRWKVGDIAALTGLTIRTLRYYDQIGLFPPSGQTDSGHRLYDEGDLSRLHQILALKELGLPLTEIQSVLKRDAPDLSEIIAAQIDRLREKIRVQQKLLSELEQASAAVRAQAPLGVEAFAKLLGMMKQSHEKFFWERRTHAERALDRLGEWLAEEPDDERDES
ncbi:MerR family transcriptional regulator [Cohnella hashimotonis]|uniref:MerR family transcriptional regulator n=1 Tax=Cohnella hashimotonis TaxID=2826895 RepID=A0ABT6TQ78_9BACL|nr:MerR family transcriptional regulator [Cohnella hashimotonis]MDI4649001.1 MerR family transcriptional regulator [Cohnella hashimotonis]